MSADSTMYRPLLPAGAALRVLKGPVAGSGYWWYRVQLLDGRLLRGGVVRGWVAVGDHDGSPWISWSVDADAGEVANLPGLPVPEGRVTGSYREQQDAEGVMVAAWELALTNWADYHDDLFVPLPGLPACDGASGASRTWVEIDADGALVVRLCESRSAQDLARIWIPTPVGVEPAYPLHIRIWDRLTGRVSESDTVGPPGTTPAPSLATSP